MFTTGSRFHILDDRDRPQTHDEGLNLDGAIKVVLDIFEESFGRNFMKNMHKQTIQDIERHIRTELDFTKYLSMYIRGEYRPRTTEEIYLSLAPKIKTILTEIAEDEFFQPKTSPPPITDPKTLTEFTLFDKLPLELRDKIWDEALSPRALEFFGPVGVSWEFDGHIVLRKAHYRSIIPLLKTSREARERVVRPGSRYMKIDPTMLCRESCDNFYKKTPKDWSEDAIIYIDPGRDIIYFNKLSVGHLEKFAQKSPGLKKLLYAAKNIAFWTTEFAGTGVDIRCARLHESDPHADEWFNTFRGQWGDPSNWLHLTKNLQNLYLVDCSRGVGVVHKQLDIPFELRTDIVAFDAELKETWRADWAKCNPAEEYDDDYDKEIRFQEHSPTPEDQALVEKQWRRQIALDPKTSQFARVELNFVVDQRQRNQLSYARMWALQTRKKRWPRNPEYWGHWDDYLAHRSAFFMRNYRVFP